MLKRLLPVVALMSLSPLAVSEDLLQVYKDAQANAPVLNSYLATNQASTAAYQSARGTLFPNIDLVGSATAGIYDVSGHSADAYNAQSGSVVLTQQIVDFNDWGTIAGAADTSDAAEATYQDQLQSFMLTIATAYFNILEDEDTLLSDRVADSFYKNTYTQTKQKFEAGLSTIKDVKQAEANYDQQLATTISDKAQLHIDQSALAQYTNKRYSQLAFPKDDFPYKNPTPVSVDWWVKQAKQNNFSLRSSRYSEKAARSNVVAQVGNQLPKLSFTGNYGFVRYDANSNTLAQLNSSKGFLHDWSIALTATWSIFNGGANFASTMQSAREYSAQSQQTLQILRNVTTKTRQDYRNVESDVANVVALQAAVTADKTTLKQLNEKYKVGTVTIVDTLDAAQQLFGHWRQLNKAQYTYMTDLLTLHADIGDLKLSNLRDINQWLTLNKRSSPIKP